MISPLFSIVGPTAVGKTSTALWLADELIADRQATSVDLISADSRQVYQGLELLTGADVPPTFTPNSISISELTETELLPSSLPFFQKEHVRWHGTSLVQPDHAWSVSHFRQLVHAVTQAFEAPGRIIILVGGTGLYHAHVTTSDPHLFVPPNPDLREYFEGQSVIELQTALEKTDATKLAALNDSDRLNPRRLIRAIEMAAFKEKSDVPLQVAVPALSPVVTLGLSAELEVLEKNIELRVAQRLKLGAVAEVQSVVGQWPDLQLPAYSATGIKDVLAYSQGQIDWPTLQAQWTLHEFQYAKRQLTWWKKKSEVKWYATSQAGYQDQLKTAVLAALAATAQD